MKTIMVQMSDEQWTMEAMHLASAMARNLNGRISLLRLVLANNPGLLGWGIAPPTAEQQRQMEEYAAVAEDYGVEFSVQPMQFITLADALGQAAELLRISVLFAHIPQSNIPFWRRFRLWSLNRQLGNCRLYTLEEEQPLSVNGVEEIKKGSSLELGLH
jgi:hypothetical protein